ncbi:MAG: zinc ribbon domain-containing protein [Candidatus Methanoplasma sp.]|jgi:RNA polymerase subunit RPABC4/transcription elongation factor Spt4|nr:zinc ribbon domain-containing protein [Candidatus Methanoplasma sp.]
MDPATESGFGGKIWAIGPKRIALTAAAFAFALLLTLFGFSASCFGMLIIAVILYMAPRLMRVGGMRFMAAFGAVFAAAAILIGGLAMAPGYVSEIDGDPPDGDWFKNVRFECSEGEVRISADVVGDVSKVAFFYGAVEGIGFRSIYGTQGEKADLEVSDGKASGTVTLDKGKLYVGHVGALKEDGGADPDRRSYDAALTGAYSGSVSSLSLYGCAVATIYVMIFYFMILVFSAFMRSRLEKTREMLESQGRLYPQGHGRCSECGSIVLPGEVVCKKCGAYIDRPDEMKPDKKEYFECSECGAEVPEDAAKCPRCGVSFDEGEEDETKECPECLALIHASYTFCPMCGANFK